jgi:hypothetical protein
MPTISTLSQGYNASKQAIQDNLPPGAARDQALAQLSTQEYTGIAGAQAAQVQAAPGILAQLGSGSAGLSVQELGAALSGYGSSGQLQGQVASENNQSKANELGLFGGLLGAAGTAGGGLLSNTGLFNSPSDSRLKKDIETLEDVLSKVGQIRVVRFRYNGHDRYHIGVIAQEIQELFPEVISPVSRPQEFLTVDYGELAAVSLAAIKQLTARVEQLEADLRGK